MNGIGCGTATEPKYPLGTKLSFLDGSGEFVVDKIVYHTAEDYYMAGWYYSQEAPPGLGGVYESEIFDTEEEANAATGTFVVCYVVKE